MRADSDCDGEEDVSQRQRRRSLSVPPPARPLSMSNAVSHTTSPNNKRSSKTAPTTSINHLLNFSLPPRQTHPAALPRRSRKTAQHGAAYNKERACALLRAGANAHPSQALLMRNIASS